MKRLFNESDDEFSDENTESAGLKRNGKNASLTRVWPQ